MKKFALIILVVITCLLSCKQKEDNTTNQAETGKDSSSQNFYKRFEGTIAGQPVVMQMHKNENKFEAVYYYKNTGGWLALSADNAFADSIIFTKYEAIYNQNNDTESADTLYPQLKCRLQNDILTGLWFSKDKKTSYPINLKESYPVGSYKFSFKRYTDSLKAFAAKQESPMAEIDNSFVVAEKNDWINNQVKRILNFDSSIGFKEGFTKLKTQYFDDYKKELPSSYDSLEMPESYNRSQTQNLYIKYNEKDIVILESESSGYSGGAHGNYGNDFFCFDVAAKKQLILSDIISADSVTLQHIVEKYFRIQYHVKSKLNEVLFNNNLPANANFYFNEKGIGFLYNPYEVASYAQGEINVNIPFSALQNYINPAFKKRINIK